MCRVFIVVQTAVPLALFSLVQENGSIFVELSREGLIIFKVQTDFSQPDLVNSQEIKVL